MSRPRVTVDLRLPHELKQRVAALTALEVAANRNGTEFRVRPPRHPLTPEEHRVLALEVCRPFGADKRTTYREVR